MRREKSRGQSRCEGGRNVYSRGAPKLRGEEVYTACNSCKMTARPVPFQPPVAVVSSKFARRMPRTRRQFATHQSTAVPLLLRGRTTRDGMRPLLFPRAAFARLPPRVRCRPPRSGFVRGDLVLARIESLRFTVGPTHRY